MSRIEILVCDHCGRHGTDGLTVETWTAVANPSGRRWTADLCTDCSGVLFDERPPPPTQARKRRRVVTPR